LVPVLGGLDVALPERPGAALRRADGVDGTPPFAVVEDAITVAFLAQRPAAAGVARVQGLHAVERLAEEVGDGGQVIRTDPDVARLARAAVAAPRAAEAQAVFVPGLAHRESLSPF